MTPPKDLFSAEDFNGWPFSEERRHTLQYHANALHEERCPYKADYLEFHRTRPISEVEIENARLREALKQISIQMTTSELEAHEEETGECPGDIEYGYDTIIRDARAALEEK